MDFIHKGTFVAEMMSLFTLVQFTRFKRIRKGTKQKWANQTFFVYESRMTYGIIIMNEWKKKHICAFSHFHFCQVFAKLHMYELWYYPYSPTLHKQKKKSFPLIFIYIYVEILISLAEISVSCLEDTHTKTRAYRVSSSRIVL